MEPEPNKATWTYDFFLHTLRLKLDGPLYIPGDCLIVIESGGREVTLFASEDTLQERRVA